MTEVVKITTYNDSSNNYLLKHACVTIGEIQKFLSSILWIGGLNPASFYLINYKLCKNNEILNLGQCQPNSSAN